MRKSRIKPWHRLWVIIPALVIFPLGFFFLWSSPCSLRSKLVITFLFVAIVGGMAVGVVSSGLYDRMRGAHEFVGEYDTSMDSRGNYRTPEILPFEREVFSAVVRKMRKLQNEYSPQPEDMSLDVIIPEAKAFQSVAEEKGIPVEDVQQIYFKVSHQIYRKKR